MPNLPMITPNTLFVGVPGLPGSPESMQPLREHMCKALKISEQNWIDFRYPVNPIWSNLECAAIARRLATFIDRAWCERNDPTLRIVIVANSMGTAIARRAFLDGMGYGDRNGPQYDWPSKVDRLIFIAGIGRGLDLATTTYRWRRVIILSNAVLKMLRLGATGREMLSGSSFLCRTRIDWIRYNQKENRRPGVVHILGDRDEISTRNDVIDIDRFDNVCIINVAADHDHAVLPSEETSHHLASAFGPLPSRPGRPAKANDVVVFLLHGIRDSKVCFAAVEREIRERSKRGNLKIRPIAHSYKKFSIADFLSPWEMPAITKWFTEEYTQELAQNPGATFHFGGHSNGTRVLGLTLQDLRSVQFERVYLAASPLLPGYPWTDIVRNGQVREIRADRGSADWAVGVCARILNNFGHPTIGPAGQDGFYSDEVREYVFPGGHNAMLVESNARSIAEFLLDGTTVVSTSEPPPPSSLFEFFVKYGDVVAIAAVGIFFVFLACLISLPWMFSFGLSWAGPVSAIIIMVSMYLIATRW